MKKHLLEYYEFSNSILPIPKLALELSKVFLNKLIKNKKVPFSYTEIYGAEIDKEFIKFDIKFIVKKTNESSLKNDNYFKGKNQADLFYKKNGYALTGNTFIKNGEIPTIEIIMVINIGLNEYAYEKVYYNINGTISHEINHLKQTGCNRDITNFNPSLDKHKNNRKNSKNNYKYFTLPEEIESIVYGMNNQSKLQGVPIDELFDEYLDSYLASNFIKPSQKSNIIKNWISYTLKYHPGAHFSDKYKSIINNI